MWKESIAQSVNEIEAQRALNFREQIFLSVPADYRLSSELPDRATLDVLQNRFMNKMSCRGFNWTAVNAGDIFEQLTSLYLQLLRWTNVTIGEKSLVLEVPYLSRYASVLFPICFLFFGSGAN